MSPRCRVVVLVSGRGSNLQSLIDHAVPTADRGTPTTGLLGAEIAAVISNVAGVRALKRAEEAGIAHETLPHKGLERREFDARLAECIDRYSPALIVLAGFMRILSAEFVTRYEGRLINIHPSLLPKYPGLHTHARALAAGDRQHGASVHFVTAGVDEGPLILQGSVPVADSDDPDTLAARVLGVEHRLLPQAVRWFADGRLTLRDGRAWLDERPALEHARLENF